MNRRHVLLLSTLVLGGCAAATKVAVGDAVVGDRLIVPVDSEWNQLSGNLSGGRAAAVWTIEGLPIDQIAFFVGIANGSELAAPGRDKRPLVFRATMQPDEVAALFEAFYTRDGSAYKLDRLEPTAFIGERGLRAQFTLVRKEDDVRCSGTLWAAVRKGELHAMAFVAPTIVFYPRLVGRVEKIAGAARLRS